MKDERKDTIITTFFATFRGLKQQLHRGNPLLHVSTVQAEALRLVEEKRRVSMKELADFLAITPPSATALANNLQKAGFLRRQADRRDRRSVYLTMTKKGSSALKAGIEKSCRIFQNLLDNLSPNEQLQFLKILKKLTKNV
ncbi:MAG TPA: MarR family transcriptional regulator [Patescibacteria group bacterium]|nr:MarR family transcriptional regulator [Patescibacteria group bacterium]